MGRAKGSLCRFSCCVCGTAELVSGGNKGFRCKECRRAFADRFFGGWTGQSAAQTQVSAAIREGLLPHARSMKCVDCNGPAVEHDHRDYNKPLDVSPVCRRCNLRRGPGIPVRGSVERLLNAGAVPYRSRRSTQMLCRAMGRPDLGEGLPHPVTLADWHRIWPELIGTEGAPSIPEQARAA